jgi:hypothetical protein
MNIVQTLVKYIDDNHRKNKLLWSLNQNRISIINFLILQINKQNIFKKLYTKLMVKFLTLLEIQTIQATLNKNRWSTRFNV